MIYTPHVGRLRFYDGTPVQPYYFQLDFDTGDLRAPEGRPRPRKRLLLDRGQLTPSSFYARDPDDAILGGLPLHFTATLDEATNATKLRQALSNPLQASPWLIGTQAILSTNATSLLRTGTGASVLVPAPDDVLEEHITVEICWEGVTVNLGRRFEEVWFPPDGQQVNEGASGVTMECNGLIYGHIAAITDFTPGIAI